MKKKIQKAIELGKIWMKNSLDPVHDYEHVERVEKHCIEVANENGFSDYELSLLLVACWWHDSYKARTSKFTLYSFLLEGFESEKIIRSELSSFLSNDEMEIVCDAVKKHNFPIWYFIFKRNLPKLTRSLYESDTLDSLNIERFREKTNPKDLFLLEIGFFTYFYYRYLTFGIFLKKSKYVNNILNNFKSH